MLWPVLAMALLVTGLADPITAAIERYRTVESYQVTLRASGSDNAVEVIRYYYQRPGFVRMEFVQPHKGAVLIYNPQSRDVRLWPFGYRRFPSLTLSPGNPLIRSRHGKRVDRSDVGALFDNVRALQQKGDTAILGEEPLGKWQTVHVLVAGRDDHTVGSVHRYHLWLERATLFPLKVVSRNRSDELIESVLMDDVEINIRFPDGFFSP